MKRLLLLLVLILSLTFEVDAKTYGIKDVPNVQKMDQTRYVSNPDGVLSADAVRQLDQICGSLRERGFAQVAIVAVEDIKSDDVYEFAIALFEGWGVGVKGADNGLGILLVENRHEIRFVTGDGIGGTMPDGLCYKIQQEYMVPHFKEGNYDKGMIEGMKVIDKYLSTGEIHFEEEDDTLAIVIAMVVVLLFILLPLVVVLAKERAKIKCPKCGKHTLKVVDRGTIKRTDLKPLITETLTCTKCGHTFTRTYEQDDQQNRGGGGGILFVPMGGFGRGGFGGGSIGGGFGGGSFGGGGAGSRW